MTRKRKTPPAGEQPEPNSNPSWNTRFQPGQSGNPRGRPKGSRNMVTLLEEELDLKISLSEEGERKTLTKRQVLIRSMVNRAIQKGDAKLIALILKLVGRDVVEDDAPLNEIDAAMIANFLKRFGQEG